ncbi:MAG: ABC transporter ATP-binding protein [Microgenomates group bacterium]
MFKTFRTFYGFIFKNKYWFLAFMLVTTFAVGIDLITPYFFKLFVESLQTSDFKELFRLILVFTGIQFAGVIFSNLKWLLNDKTAVDVGVNIRATIFKYVQDLDFVFHSNKSTGAMISTFKRGDNAFWGMFEKIHIKAWEIIVGLVVMVYFFSNINPIFITIFMISFVLTLIVTKYLGVKNITTRRAFNEWDDKISGIVTDNLISFETVKLFAKEDWELKRLQNTFVDWKKSLWKHFWTYRAIDMTVGTLVTISISTVLILSLNLIIKNQITIGDFVLVASYINIFFPKLFDLIYNLRDITTDYTDIKKYFDLLDNEIKVKDPTHPLKINHVYGDINFDKISFSYGLKRTNAIDKINLEVKRGESIALVGRSGSGKTTLVKLLMRFYDVNSGKITLDGHNVKDFDKSTLRSFIGVVPQEPILFNNTIGYNIGYGKDNPKLSDIKKAAELANIKDFIESLPKKYQTNVGERGIKLSGGQKQRLAIARMILSDPDIIIFDEATSQLDSESEKLIQDAFWEASYGKTTFIIAHRLSTVRKADKIVVMEYGKIKEVGTHKELLAKKNSLYSHFWNLQIKLD